MSNTKINVEEKITILYDHIYNKSIDQCFKVGQINYDKVNLDDIKINFLNKIRSYDSIS